MTHQLINSSGGVTAVIISAALLAILALLRRSPSKITVRFKSLYAPHNFYNVAPEIVSKLTHCQSCVTLAGGVALDGWGPFHDQVYATSNFNPVSDGKTFLPGKIEITFLKVRRSSLIAVNVCDGGNGNVYIARSYDCYDNVLSAAEIALRPGQSDLLSLSGSNICRFDIAANGCSRSNFAIREITIFEMSHAATQINEPPNWCPKQSNCRSLIAE